MVKRTSEEWREVNANKIKYYYTRGFNVDAVQCVNNEWIPIYTDKYPGLDVILDTLENPHYTNVLCCNDPEAIAIICNKVAFARLKLPTMAIYDSITHRYIYLCKCETSAIEDLKQCNEIKVIRADSLHIFFNRGSMPQIIMPKSKDFKLKTLPTLTYTQIQKVLKVNEELESNKGYNFPINKGIKYRISSQTLQLLSNPILTLQEKRIFEHVLLLITNSSFVLDTSMTSNKYRVSLRDFTADIKLSRTSQTKETIISEAFTKFQLYSLIDDFVIKAGMLTFTAEALCVKLKRQNIQREVGFYNNIPGTKQSCIVASWLDYLYLISSFTRDNKQLQIALDTLLDKLQLTYLIEQSRISKIAELLTQLNHIAYEYGFLEKKVVFDSSDIKHLLKNRQGLKGYMVIDNCPKSDKGEKKKC